MLSASEWQAFSRRILQWMWGKGGHLQNLKAVNEIYNMLLLMLSPQLGLSETVHPVYLSEHYASPAQAGQFWAALRDEFYAPLLAQPLFRPFLVVHYQPADHARVYTIEDVTFYREAHAPLVQELFGMFFEVFYPYDEATGCRQPCNVVELAACDPIGTLYMELIANGYGAGTNRDIGSFFTPRWLTQEIVARVDPRWDMRCTDLACGTGGFLTSIAVHVRAQLQAEADAGTISAAEFHRRWHVFASTHVWGTDISPDVVKPLGINLLAHGLVDALPHMTCQNRLEVVRHGDAIASFDCILINPPFGKKTYDLPPAFVHPDQTVVSVPRPDVPAENYWAWILGADKKTPHSRCGLQFVVAQYRMLRPGGRAAFVIDVGFLSNKDARRVREGLLTHTQVTDVYICPSGTFEHTGITTCTVLYQKQAPPTREVRLWSRKPGTVDPLRVSLETLRAHAWSLDPAEYDAPRPEAPVPDPDGPPQRWCLADGYRLADGAIDETIVCTPYLACLQKKYPILDLRTPVPSLARQHAVAKTLQVWWDLSDEAKMELLQEYDAFQWSAWDALHAGVDTDAVLLGELYPIQIGGTPPSKEPRYYEGGTIPWACVSDLTATECLERTQRHLTTEGADYLGPARRIARGSVLLSFKLSIGKVAYTATDMYCNEAIAFFGDTDRCAAKYLFYLFQRTDFARYARGCIGGGNLNKDVLRKIPLRIPPLPVQRRIAQTMTERAQQYREMRGVYALWRQL